ncbi:MAG: NAD-dependent epimerase/dehydratase family protein [Acidobacteria bacterium]|nr:MAG: NAD-dependent epimerase/dehydratase family protein [Acidobacteriota bacterium]
MGTKTSLVTGVAGFLGSHVARHLIHGGHRVVGIDDLSGGFIENVPEGVDFRPGSINDDTFVRGTFSEGIDYVFHLAAYAAEGLSHYIRVFNYTNNVIGSMNLVNAAIRNSVRRFVFTSSIAVYGAGQLPMKEGMEPSPEDPYGIAKYAVELDLRAAREQFGLDFTVFRPHNVYGENQNIGDRYRNVVGIFMNQIMHDEPMTVFGDGTQTRAFSYVDDVAPVLADSINHESASGRTFNVGADTPYSVLRLASVVAQTMGVEPKIQHLPARKEVEHAFSDHTASKEVFGARETVPLEVGISRMAKWAKRVGPRQSNPFTGIEVRKNFPMGWDLEMDSGS